MGILEDFGYDQGNNTSYSPDEQTDTPRKTDTDLPTAIIQTAKQIGINPLDLATAISYETGGSFDPWKKGPTTQWGTHRGLIQWGEPQAKQYGVGPNTPVGDQLRAVGRYLTDRGVKAGMGLLDIYSAINAGHVGLYDRSDAGNGGAPGTVRDKVERQMAGHKIKAAQLLGFKKFDPAPTPSVPGYSPRIGPRRQGSLPGIGYIEDGNGGYTLANDEPPTAMFYGPPRQHTMARPDYIRSGIPGVQEQYVPPEMRGPFRRVKTLPIETGSYTVGAPTTEPVLNTDAYTPADSDLPGLPLDDAPPIDEQLAALLSQPIKTAPTPAILDQDQGINLSQTVPNISVPSQDIKPLTVPANTVKPEDIPTAVPTPKVDTLPIPPARLPAGPVAVPISTNNMPDLPRTEVVQKDEPTSFMDVLNDATSVAKDTLHGGEQFGAKVAGNVTGLPFELFAGVRAAVPSFSGIDRRASAENLAHQGQKMREGVDFAFGVSPTGKSLFEKAAVLAGRNLTPMGTQTLAATGLMSAADLASQFIGTANAKPLITKEEAENLLFPGVGNNQIGPKLPPRVTHTVMTSAGPYKLDDANYKLLGVMGAVTIGAALLPTVAGRIISTKQGARLGRKINNVPTNVEAFSNRMDLLRTYDDKTAGLMRVAHGIGVDPLVLNEMRQNFDFQSGSSVRNYANAFVTQGEAHSPNFSLQVKTPIVKLAQAENDDVTRYMHLWHTLDQIREADRVALAKTPQSAYGKAASMPSPGPSVVRGMTKSQVIAEIKAMDASPTGQALKDFRSAYSENLKTVRNFLYQGEYATLSREGYHIIQRRKPNEIHQNDLDIENTDATPAKVSSTLADHTQEQMRIRMENQAKGYFIDQAVAHNPKFAEKVTPAEFAKNKKSWGPNSVTFYRRGKKEIWITDPFIAEAINMDVYMPTGVLSNIANGTRRFMEKTTTGVAAPWFAFTSMYRNHKLAQVSAEQGFKSPNIALTLAAVPQQLYPQMAKFFSTKLDDWSDGWLGNTLGQQNLHGLSLKAAQVYDQSMYALLSKHGGVHTSMFLDYNQQAANKISAALQSAPIGSAKTFLSGFKNLFDAIHNSSNFAYATRNIRRGKSAGEAARSAKQLTGDPQKLGRFYASHGKPIRFADDGSFTGRLATKAVQTYGAVTEVGRQASPWWNVTTQGMKRIGKAYIDNPTKFVAQQYLHNIMPAAALYMYTRGLGTDPNGVSYTDYAMNRRSSYNTLMNIYVPIPGRPAEEGISVPLPHEIAAVWAVTNASLHHATGSELFGRADDFMRTALSMVGKDYQPSNDVPLRSWSEDIINTSKNVRDVALTPAVPPIIGSALGYFGIVTPNGPFGGAYQRHNDAFDDEGMNTSLELVSRALAPGIADIIGSGYAAFTHSPDAFSGIGSGIKAGVKRGIEKTPFVRDVIGWKPPVTGSTQVTEDLFGDKKILSLLTKYYKSIDSVRDRSDKRERGSKEGRLVADMFMPSAPPSFSHGNTLGLPAKPPVNALYNAFMEELDRRINKDVISERGKGKEPSGGIGWRSQMARYSEFTDHIKALRKIDGGNMVTWKRRIEGDPDLLAYLKENNVPIDNPQSVKNFLEMQRQTAARQLLFTLKALEQDFRKRLGDPNFSFEKLNPNQPYLLPPGMQPKPFAPEWPSYAKPLGIIK